MIRGIVWFHTVPLNIKQDQGSTDQARICAPQLLQKRAAGALDAPQFVQKLPPLACGSEASVAAAAGWKATGACTAA